MREKIKYRLRILRSLKPFAFGVKKYLLLNFLISAATMTLGFIQPLFYKLFIDQVILNQKLPMMPFIIAGYLAVFIATLGFSYLKNYSTNRLVNRTAFRVKTKILRGFFNRDFQSYDHQSVGDMKMRLDDDTACIAAYAGAQTVDYIIAYATLIVSAALLFFIEWRLALFSYMAIPLTFLFDHFIAKREAVLLNNERENDQSMSNWLHSSVQGWREIKALNLQKHEEQQFAKFIHKYAIIFGTWINYWVIRVLIIPKIKEEFLMQFSLYFFGGLLIIGGDLEIGSLLVFMQYYVILSTAIKTVSDSDADLLTTMPQSKRMLEELSRISVKNDDKEKPEKTSSSFEFRNVTFAYQGTRENAVNNLSFAIGNGERVAIIGKSGAGKTTVLKLMMGMLRPTNGTVLFSGINIDDLPIDVLHQKIGFAMQENILFNDSIRENLFYGKDNATDNELESACKKAFIYDFIKSLPHGFDTIIGERGIKLSGGQRQRIILARLFLRNVDVLIFDEATSALDQYSESIIQDAILHIGQDKTIIVVAHRKSSLTLCDRVITL